MCGEFFLRDFKEMGYKVFLLLFLFLINDNLTELGRGSDGRNPRQVRSQAQTGEILEKFKAGTGIPKF